MISTNQTLIFSQPVVATQKNVASDKTADATKVLFYYCYFLFGEYFCAVSENVGTGKRSSLAIVSGGIIERKLIEPNALIVDVTKSVNYLIPVDFALSREPMLFCGKLIVGHVKRYKL